MFASISTVSVLIMFKRPASRSYTECPYIMHLKRIYHLTYNLTGTCMHIGLLVCNTLFQILGKLRRHSTCICEYVRIYKAYSSKNHIRWCHFSSLVWPWISYILYDCIYTNETMYCLTGNGEVSETPNKM